MTYTEDDLRGLLAERTAYVPGRATDVTRIVRRGRRTLMVRWGAGVALTGAAAAAVLWLLPGAAVSPAPAPAAQPSGAAESTAQTPAGNLQVGRDYPPTRLGGLARIGGVVHDKSAVGNDLKVEPASTGTTVAFACEDRGSWVVTSVDGAGRVSRCAGGQARHTFRENELPRDWTKKKQSIRVWVFPDTPLVTESTLAGCALPEKDTGMCDGRYAAGELVRYDVALQLAADLGVQPGAWMVGVYDKD